LASRWVHHHFQRECPLSLGEPVAAPAGFEFALGERFPGYCGAPTSIRVHQCPHATRSTPSEFPSSGAKASPRSLGQLESSGRPSSRSDGSGRIADPHRPSLRLCTEVLTRCKMRSAPARGSIRTTSSGQGPGERPGNQGTPRRAGSSSKVRIPTDQGFGRFPDTVSDVGECIGAADGGTPPLGDPGRRARDIGTDGDAPASEPMAPTSLRLQESPGTLRRVRRASPKRGPAKPPEGTRPRERPTSSAAEYSAKGHGLGAPR